MTARLPESLPWVSVKEPPAFGDIVKIRCIDALGFYEPGGDFFLNDDGHWYRIEPPYRLVAKPTHWRPT